MNKDQSMMIPGPKFKTPPHFPCPTLSYSTPASLQGSDDEPMDGMYHQSSRIAGECNRFSLDRLLIHKANRQGITAEH
jgi:hypothetical protein